MKEIQKQQREGEINKKEGRALLRHLILDFTKHMAFSWIVAFVILLNVFVMLLQVDYPDLLPEVVWGCMNHTLVLFFTVELGLRMFAEGWDGFFCHAGDWGWNLFDFTVVSISWLMYLSAWLEPGVKDPRHDKGSRIVKLLRTVRMLRILRVLRIFKLQCLEKLSTIVNGLISSFSVVAWIAVMQVIVMFCSAIVCTNSLGQQAHEWEEGDDREDIVHYFGSMASSGMTLFQFLTLSDWTEVTRLVAKRNLWMAGFFVVYICFAAMVILSLLTGVLADHVNTVREQQEIEDKVEAREHFSEALKAEYRAFRQADTSGRHAIDKQRFKEILSRASFREELKICGVDLADFDPSELFDSFDSMGEGHLTWHDFRMGMEEMRTGVVPKGVFKLEASLKKAIASCEGKARVHSSGVYDQAQKERALHDASGTADTVRTQLENLIASMEECIEWADEETTGDHEDGSSD